MTTVAGPHGGRFGEPPPAALLDAGERLTREELLDLQLRRLRATLRHAYDHVELYRRKFDAAGVTPRRLPQPRRPRHASRSPPRPTCATTTRSACSPSRCPRCAGCTPPPAPPAAPPWSATPRATSRAGPTWSPARIRAAGGRPGHQVHVAYGYGLFTGGLGAHYGAERAGCTVIPASGGMTARQVQLIQDFEPEVIMVTPSYMLTLLDEFERQGIDPRAGSLRIGIFGAEPWTEQMRTEIEERIGLHAVDIYGLSEVIGPGVAAGVRRDQGRPARVGGPLPPGDRRPAHRRGAAGRRDRANWSSPR